LKKEFDYRDLLQPENMIHLYAQGAFPMADDKGAINWYLPEIRTVIPLDNYNTPRSLKQFMKKNHFEIIYDKDKIDIIKECARREKTWITEELIEAYKKLDELGHIHSVGVYRDNNLVGGLYGVTFRGAFFGESMFSRVTQASKVALYHLIEHLNRKGFVLLDVQYMTDHLKMFGAVEISFEEYLNLLLKAYGTITEF